MDGGGEVLRRDRESTDRSAIRHYFQEVGPAKDITAVMEACYGWEYFHDEVKGLRMAHPLKTRLIAEARIKAGSIDSGALAHLMRADLVAEAYAPPFETRDRKNLMRFRASLTRLKVMVKKIVHSVFARKHVKGEALRALSDKFGKGGRTIMRQLKPQGQRHGDTESLPRPYRGDRGQADGRNQA
jgi:transposase